MATASTLEADVWQLEVRLRMGSACHMLTAACAWLRSQVQATRNGHIDIAHAGPHMAPARVQDQLARVRSDAEGASHDGGACEDARAGLNASLATALSRSEELAARAKAGEEAREQLAAEMASMQGTLTATRAEARKGAASAQARATELTALQAQADEQALSRHVPRELAQGAGSALDAALLEVGWLQTPRVMCGAPARLA